ncbi:terpenoid synthase [Gloeopeniophorella convolvens]|nr:terpenoid synthase [Gloeopeniophorella convolvens]
MPPSRPQIRLREPLARWPWSRALNDHYLAIKPECDAWVRSFGALSIKAQKSFDLCNFPLLGALMYPLNDKDCLRVACELMVLGFMFDEFTDNVDDDGARAYADMITDAVLNPHRERPEGEAALGEIARQYVHVFHLPPSALSDTCRYWLRALRFSSLPAQRRFIQTFGQYVYAVIDEAADRARGEVRCIEGYLRLRRHTAGGYPCFFAAELDLDIPDEVMAHPAMASLLGSAAESFVLTNDPYSYNIEQASGHDGHNLVTVVMTEKNIGLDDALDWIAEHHAGVLSQFESQAHILPSWGSTIDAQVKTFVDRLGYWIRGFDCWSFESERYFGASGLEVQKRRVVTLLPKVKAQDVTPMTAPAQFIEAFDA